MLSYHLCSLLKIKKLIGLSKVALDLKKVIFEKQKILKQKDLLVKYRMEYSKKFQSIKSIGMHELKWKNYNNFLYLLEKNIFLKHKILIDNELLINKISNLWIIKKKKVNIYNKLGLKFLKNQKYKNLLHSERINDNFFLIFS